MQEQLHDKLTRRKAALLVIQKKVRQFICRVEVERARKLEAIRRRLVLLKLKVHIRGKLIRLKIAKARRDKHSKRKNTDPPALRMTGWMEKFYASEKPKQTPKPSEFEREASELNFSQQEESRLQLNTRPDILDVEELTVASDDNKGEVVFHPFYRGSIKRYLMPTVSYKNKWRTAEYKPAKDKYEPQSFLESMALQEEQPLEPLILSSDLIDKVPALTLSKAYRSKDLNYMSPTFSSSNTFSFELPLSRRTARMRKYKQFLRPTTVSRIKSEHQRAKKLKLTVPLEEKYRRLPGMRTRPVSVSPVFPARRPKPTQLTPVRVFPPLETPYEDPYIPPKLQSLSFEEALPSLHRIVELYTPLRKHRLKD